MLRVECLSDSRANITERKPIRSGTYLRVFIVDCMQQDIFFIMNVVAVNYATHASDRDFLLRQLVAAKILLMKIHC